MSSLATAEARTALAVAAASCVALLLAGIVSVWPLTLVALLVFLGLACLSPTGVLAGSIASLPYFYRPLDVSGQQFAASELLLLLSAIGTVVRLVYPPGRSMAEVRGELRSRLAAALTSPVVLASLVLVVVGGFLVAFPYDAAHRAESLREWRWTLAEPVLLLGLLAWHGRCRWLPELAAFALIAGGAFASLHALADLALGGGVSVGGVTRIAGPYLHPNALALMTIRITALAFVWAVLDPRVRRYVVPLLAVCGLAVAITFSRGAMLAGFVALALVLVNAPARLRLIGAGSAALTLLLGVAVARDRMLDLFNGGSGSLRLDIWSSALAMIDDRPVRGYGPDQFLYAYLPRYVQPTAWGERFTAHAHNFLLDFWIRLGIIGAAFALFMVMLCLIALARQMRDTRHPQPLGMAALVALVATFAHGLVDNAFFSHDLAMSCWLLAWLAFGTRSDVAGTEGGVNIARAGVGRGRLHWLASVR